MIPSTVQSSHFAKEKLIKVPMQFVKQDTVWKSFSPLIFIALVVLVKTEAFWQIEGHTIFKYTVIFFQFLDDTYVCYVSLLIDNSHSYLTKTHEVTPTRG